VLKRAYFVAVINGVFCLGCACDKQTRDTFQSLRLTGVRLWAVITLQTLWWEIGGWSTPWNILQSIESLLLRLTVVIG